MTNPVPLVSISVPVYNAEKYLCQCLDSLVNQTLSNIEIIIVNDGSTDGSEAICQEYAKKDSRIILINKENGGLASARQVALEVATGEYFCACDADDWVEPNMYERLYQKAGETGADIVMCDYWSEYSGRKQSCHSCKLKVTGSTDLFGDAINGKLPCQVWNKLFKRDIFEKYSVFWEPDINLGEDFLIMLKILQHPVSMVHLATPLYHYRRIISSTSYTNNITMDTFNQSLFIRHWIKKNIDPRKYSNSMFRLWINLAFTGLRIEDNMNKQYYQDEVMCNIPFIGFLKYSYPKTKGFLIFLTKLFGYDFGKRLYEIGYESVYK